MALSPGSKPGDSRDRDRDPNIVPGQPPIPGCNRHDKIQFNDKKLYPLTGVHKRTLSNYLLEFELCEKSMFFILNEI